jgi:hypothetical protein
MLKVTIDNQAKMVFNVYFIMEKDQLLIDDCLSNMLIEFFYRIISVLELIADDH